MRRSATKPAKSSNVLYYYQEFSVIKNNLRAILPKSTDNPDLVKIRKLVEQEHPFDNRIVGNDKNVFLFHLIDILMLAKSSKNPEESAILDKIRSGFGKVLQPDKRLQDAQREVKQQLNNYDKSWLRWGWNKITGEPREIQSLRKAASSSLDYSNGTNFFDNVDRSIWQQQARRQYIDDKKRTSSLFWNGVNALRKAWARFNAPPDSIFQKIADNLKNTIPNAAEKITSLNFIEPSQLSQAPSPSDQFHLKYVTQLHAQGLAKPQNLQLLNECKDEQEAQRMVYVMEALDGIGGAVYASSPKDRDSLTSKEYREWVQLFQRAFEGYSRNESAESPIEFLERCMSPFRENDKHLKISHIRKLFNSFNSPADRDNFVNSITFRNRITEYPPLSSTAEVLQGTNILVDNVRGVAVHPPRGVTTRTTVVDRNGQSPQPIQTLSSQEASHVVSPNPTKSKPKKHKEHKEHKKRNNPATPNENAGITITQTPRVSANSVHTLTPRRDAPPPDTKKYPGKERKKESMEDHGRPGISSRTGG